MLLGEEEKQINKWLYDFLGFNKDYGENNVR